MKNPIRCSILFFTPSLPNFHLSTGQSVDSRQPTVGVSALCQRVSPFKTLHALYLSGLCQRVSLICKKSRVCILSRQTLFTQRDHLDVGRVPYFGFSTYGWYRQATYAEQEITLFECPTSIGTNKSEVFGGQLECDGLRLARL